MEDINQWITINYNDLLAYAKRCSSNNYSDLISLFYLYLISPIGLKKFEMIDDNLGKLKYSYKWMRNNANWRNSEFNKTIRVNNLPDDIEIEDESINEYIDVICENERDDIKELILDMNRTYGEYNANKLLTLRKVYLQLETTDKVIWDLYFTEMLTMRGIAKKLDIPLSSIFSMVTDLKKKIKELCLK